MKTIGLIGGMSWQSTATYYRIVNEVMHDRLGGLHSARVILHSVDFAVVERMQRDGDWPAAGRLLAAAARSVQAAGADFVVLCTNTMHVVAPAIESAVDIPLLHIADPTANAVKAAGFGTVGLLGTGFTMERGFYKDRLAGKHGLHVIVPGAEDRAAVHRIIYEELCVGHVSPRSRDEYRRVIEALARAGAEAVILGCTEISLLIGEADCEVPLFDTTAIHARSAAEHALS